MRPRTSTRFLVALATLIAAFPAAAGAQTDPYGADPLGLIAFTEQSRVYTTGVDQIEVFVCDVPDGAVGVELSAAVATINAALQPYFTWLSGGVYRPQFVVGATVVASQASGWPESVAFQSECESLAAQASSGTAAGALVIVDAAYSGGYATAGASCDVASECPTSYPANGRIMVVGASTVVQSGGLPNARLSTVAHELGHALEFPHSYGGLTKFLNGVTYEYDNPMDIMSGGSLTELNVGTLAVNRYAAGWLPQATAFHRGNNDSYVLALPGVVGNQMLVLPTDVAGVFTMLGARGSSSFDFGIAEEGIEVYQIDQRGTACGQSIGFVCWGADRRTIPFPATDDPASSAHVLAVGETLAVGGALVTVDARSNGRWDLTISGSTVSERFLDDNGSIHEANISAIAALGVTKGCNPPLNSLYCTAASVTRAEMAVFLIRALSDDVAPSSGLGVFPDVPSNLWYSSAVARLVELGITTGYPDGTYQPNAAVTRGEMAVFLDRAFDAIGSDGVLAPFEDVSVEAFYAPAADALFDSGVTLGCSADPLAYCPLDAVTRGQMASFLARVLAG